MRSAYEMCKAALEAYGLPGTDPGHAVTAAALREVRDRIAAAAADRSDAWLDGARTALEAQRAQDDPPRARLRAV